jgi:hypothetical protein
MRHDQFLPPAEAIIALSAPRIAVAAAVAAAILFPETQAIGRFWKR